MKKERKIELITVSIGWDHHALPDIGQLRRYRIQITFWTDFFSPEIRKKKTIYPVREF